MLSLLFIELKNSLGPESYFPSRWRGQGRRVVLWGSGSKAVGFLTTLSAGGASVVAGAADAVEAVVDINPRKHGTYMAGTGQKIVAPGFLKEFRPDVVIVMNPIYCTEIQHDLNKMGIQAQLVPAGPQAF